MSMVKKVKNVIDKETESFWKIERRTRGAAAANESADKPMQTWVLILTNKHGHRRFVPEHRIWEDFKPVEEA